MPLAQTITIVNKSNKVVKTGKSLTGVFKDAQAAYRERKAEIQAVRRAEIDEKRSRRARERLEVDTRVDTLSQRSSGPSSPGSSPSPRTERADSHVRRKTVPPGRPRPQRQHSGSSHSSRRSERHSPRSPHKHAPSRLRFEDHLDSPPTEVAGRELVRRNTDGQIPPRERRRPSLSSRSASMTEIEMSLAYGELPDWDTRPRSPLLAAPESELVIKASRLQQMLDEANCVQHSAFAMIEQLQKNPEQMAAVALTLGEISTLVKAAPAALGSLKTAFPAVFALLASPQFAIAVGVGVGITVIAFGGYKIIQRIKAKRDGDKLIEGPEGDEEEDEELQEIRSNLSRIEVWRRGIADAQADSRGTSVEGEFITPAASKQLVREGRLRETDLKSTKSTKSTKSKKGAKEKGRRTEKDSKRRKDHDGKRHGRHEDEESVFDRGKALIRDLNGVRSLFKKDREVKKAESSLV